MGCDGNTIKITFISDEKIADPVVTFTSGGAAINAGRISFTNTNSPNKTEWTAQYDAADGDTDGTVAFTIDFDDLTGNSGTRVTTVTDASGVTYDDSAPTLSSVGITSDNDPVTRTNAGDVVTLQMTANEEISEPVVTFTAGGAAITDNSIDYVNINGNTWTASYTTHASDTEGAVAFSIAFTNKAGIAGVADIDVDGSSSVFYDETAPTLTTVSIASNNVDASGGSIGTHANPR